MYKSGLNESDTIHRILNRKKHEKIVRMKLMNKKWWKISISHVEMKMKIVALKINSWEKKNIEEKKKLRKQIWQRKNQWCVFVLMIFEKKKIESKWTMLFCCKLALANWKKITKRKKAKIEISTKKSQFAWEVKYLIEASNCSRVVCFSTQFYFHFPPFFLSLKSKKNQYRESSH